MEKTYTNTEIQKITGLTKNQVIHLVESDVIQPYRDNTGRGMSRLFNWKNLVQIMICKELSVYHIDRRLMRGVLAHLNEDREDVIHKYEKGGLVVKPQKVGDKIDFWTKAAMGPLATPFLTIFPLERGYGFGLHAYSTIEFFLKYHKNVSMIVIDLERILSEAKLHL